ncbi:hemerythrin domain-containing protein [Notoacmeibacter sp. MSK16QG-6]|uniref:hemerythrin domain-containing protein n=1 Tax=Notoacmeibacter sp. MSK16QG-6 TaxID=2957982 RepID=UPI00209CA11A|nr:hemerythrin domain-containing protein [Notoacmeibacter sp. MSK16QG-6]MCP1198877.1 hemerythrin domain-containing protein [Notoacmeibacter sp. MSK16QG-6]
MTVDDKGPALELDEAARPAVPTFEVAAQQRNGSRHLRAIHEHHRRQLSGLKKIFSDLERGDASADDMVTAAQSLSMTDNLRRFGTLCGQECQALVFHHQIEDGAMYPQLQRSEELKAVIDQLMAEHQVVHAQIVALWDATTAFLEKPDDPTKRRELGRAIERLQKTVLSHFGYEEDALLDAIDHFSVAI